MLSAAAAAADTSALDLRDPLLEFTVVRFERTAVITARGDIDVSNAAMIEEIVFLAWSSGAELVLFDLAEIAFVDQEGLRAVDRLRSSRTPFVILRVGRAVTYLRDALRRAEALG